MVKIEKEKKEVFGFQVDNPNLIKSAKITEFVKFHALIEDKETGSKNTYEVIFRNESYKERGSISVLKKAIQVESIDFIIEKLGEIFLETVDAKERVDLKLYAIFPIVDILQIPFELTLDFRTFDKDLSKKQEEKPDEN
ncbi:MAG: hypothetical protein QXP22_02430 [Candidatus Anstonellales archaeon]